MLRHVQSVGMARSADSIGWECDVLHTMVVEDLRNVVRELAATVMWLSATDVPQVVEVAEIGSPLPVESQLALMERIKGRIAEQMVDCTPYEGSEVGARGGW